MTVTASASAPQERSSSRATKRLVFRSIKLPAALAVFILVLALSAFGIIAWRGMQHLTPVDQHLAAITRLQQAGLGFEDLTIRNLNGFEVPKARLAALRRALDAAIAKKGFLAPGTERRLADAQTALAGLGVDPKASLVTTISLIRKALAAEVLAHARLLSKLRHDLVLEFSLTGAAFLVLSGLGVLLVIRLRRRVLGPLDTLEQLLAHLANRDFSLAPIEGVDPMIQPLTASYNHLVNRLMELEEESARYRNTLEHEVRTATEALLEQNRNLAAAERLAAAGEVAARIAHELRNPLAGMQMALSNIRTECNDREDVVERLDLVIDELRRVTGLLNGLLDQSRITPEPVVDTMIRRTVEELLAIVRYQIPRKVHLECDIPEEIVCRVPKDSVRQALLNLILNAADAIGERRGRIVIRAAAINDMFELSVSDDGPGFPSDLLREGVGPFRTGRAGGTGLGLSIVSRLVRNLDGRIELSNLEPHGACVRLILPVRGTHA